MNIYKINFGKESGFGIRFIKADSHIEVLDILRHAEYPIEYLEDLEIDRVSLDPIPNLNAKGDLDYTWKYIKDEFKIEKSKILNSDNYQTLLGE